MVASAVGQGYLASGKDLVTGLGGPAGFGEFTVPRNDDGSSSVIDITPVFGPAGLNFFGQPFTSLYVNNNGNVTFLRSTSQFTPSVISAGASNPIIAPFWGDVDTRGPSGGITPGGTSRGTNLVYYDLDTVNRVFTVTWDDVGYYASRSDKLNAFQLQLVDEGAGQFDIIFRYEAINWTTGEASGGTNGLGGQVARAGYSAGNSAGYFELAASGNQAEILALDEAAGNTGRPGVWTWRVSSTSGTVSTVSGTDGPDILTGGAQADLLLGRAGADALYGGSADDRLVGAGGNDTVSGGDGVDTAFFRGARAEYRITQTAPDTTVVEDLVGGRDATDTLIAVELLSFLNPEVYRFYNTRAGGHFFTTSPAERDYVIATLPMYNFEGTGFFGDDVGAPVYRFYNTRAGGHFFTTSEAERDYVIGSLPMYNYEGTGFFCSTTPQEGYAAVYRFYNTVAGGHFFTTSPAERDYVIGSLPMYNFEGIGYYVPITAVDPVFSL